MSGFALDLYKPVAVSTPFLFTSSATHDLSLVHPHIPPLSTLPDIRRHGPLHSVPHRLLLWSRRSSVGFPCQQASNSDTFPSGYSQLARWGLPLQEYTTPSTFHRTIPSTAGLSFTVRDLPGHPCPNRTLTLSGVSSDPIVAEIIGVASLTLLLIPILSVTPALQPIHAISNLLSHRTGS